MAEQDGSYRSNFDRLSDRMLAENAEMSGVTIKTNLDPKNVLEDNPYFNKTKNYTKEELEKLKKFFGD